MARRECPFCKEKVQENATICKHCKSALTPLPPKKWYQTWKGLIIILFIGQLVFYGRLFIEEPTHETTKTSENAKETAKKPVQMAKPYVFKDFKLGMTLEEFKKLKPRVTFAENKKFEATRLAGTTIGTIKGEAFFLFEDCGKGLQLSYISITIPKLDFITVKDALKTKYGPPTSTSDISKSNAMGAKFDGVKLIWDNDISEIVIESIGNKIDETEIVFRHKKLGQSRQSKEDSAKAKKDI